VLAVPLLLAGLQAGRGTRFQRDTPIDTGPPRRALIGVIGIRGIAKYRAVVFSQALGQFGDIGHIRRGDRYGVNHTTLDIRPHVNLHAEVPLIALLGLMQVGVAGLVPMLGRGGRMDEGGIDPGAPFGSKLSIPSLFAQQGRLFRRPVFPHPLSLPSGGDTGSGTGSPA